MTRKAVIVEADGGSRGNPGPAGFGALVRDPATGAVLAERSGGLGVATNNVAEYSGLIAGLQAAAELGATDVEVRMDSKLVIEQMAGRWQIKHPALRPLAAQAAALVHTFGTVRYVWVPRERNTTADALANQAMDENAQPRTQNWEPRTDKPTRIVLVRHGQTALTAERRYSGRGDVPLSPTGEEQAQAAAARVAKFGPVAVILSSPLSRCTRTAEHLAAAIDPVPRVAIVEDLIECDFGRWEGLTFAEVREQEPVQLQAWLASTAAAPPGGESFQQVAQRVRKAMNTIRDAYAGDTVVIVSHVSPIKLILRDALGASDALLHRLYLDPAGVSVVDVYADGGVAVRTVNETAHLV